MRTLYVIRHAKAMRPPGLADYERPLEVRGREDAARLGKWLKARSRPVDLVVHSGAKRAAETAAILAHAWNGEAPLTISKTLYEAEPEEVMTLVRALSDEDAAVAIVGHNPSFHVFAAELAQMSRGEDADQLRAKFPTCGAATFAFDVDSWRDAVARNAKLEFFVFPRKL